VDTRIDRGGLCYCISIAANNIVDTKIDSGGLCCCISIAATSYHKMDSFMASELL
jgi:hypothetical protein